MILVLLYSLILKIKFMLKYSLVENAMAANSNNCVAIVSSLGGIGILKGFLLKFDSADTSQDVFFILSNSPFTETRVNVYSGIKPSEIHFQIPVLSSGFYSVVVKTISKNGNYILKGGLKEIISI